jgi:probable HAF family extracellular repeat protein
MISAKRSLALLGGFAACGAMDCVAQEYTVVDLGTLGEGFYSEATGVNNYGDVTGHSFLPNEDERGFLYIRSQNKMISIGTLGGNYSFGKALNDSEVVTGESLAKDGNLHAFLYSDGSMIDIGAVIGKKTSTGKGINASGQVVGTAGNSNRGFLYDFATHTFSWLPTGEVFAELEPEGINSFGQIGGIGNGDIQHAFRLTGSTVKDLGTLPDYNLSGGFAINDAGEECGWSEGKRVDGEVEDVSRAVLFSGGAVHKLPGLHGYPETTGEALDSSGQCVGLGNNDDYPNNGAHAFIYNSVGGMQDLNSKIASDAGWELQGASGISDTGYIAGSGMHTGTGYRAFLLVPNPTIILKANIFALDQGDPECIQCAKVLVPEADSLPDSLVRLTDEQRKEAITTVNTLIAQLEDLLRAGEIKADQKRLLTHDSKLVLAALETTANSGSE